MRPAPRRPRRVWLKFSPLARGICGLVRKHSRATWKKLVFSCLDGFVLLRTSSRPRRDREDFHQARAFSPFRLSCCCCSLTRFSALPSLKRDLQHSSMHSIKITRARASRNGEAPRAPGDNQLFPKRRWRINRRINLLEDGKKLHTQILDSVHERWAKYKKKSPHRIGLRIHPLLCKSTWLKIYEQIAFAIIPNKIF